MKQRWPSQDGEVASVVPRIRWPHYVLDNDSSKKEDWNQDEANDSKTMMVYWMGYK